jgi:hypothetical protein
MSMKEVRWGAVFPDIEASSSMIQCKVPPFSAKSVYLSVNLPSAWPSTAKRKRPQVTHTGRAALTGEKARRA